MGQKLFTKEATVTRIPTPPTASPAAVLGSYVGSDTCELSQRVKQHPTDGGGSALKMANISWIQETRDVKQGSRFQARTQEHSSRGKQKRHSICIKQKMI